ncbi:SOD1 [Mytilus edulis]|uniref:SOD1 n=1 Tax=Mytilus edulis TaxID=6550 RepID=A0A8S3RJ82_MYTED|nr:SOD1 [Mytilus edulis]
MEQNKDLVNHNNHMSDMVNTENLSKVISGVGPIPQAGGGQFPQAGAGQFQQGAGAQFPQAGAGQFQGQAGAGQFAGQAGAGQFAGQGAGGQFPGQPGAGQFQGQAGAAQFPGQAGGGQFPGQQPAAGQFQNVGGFGNPFGGVGNFLGGNDGTFGANGQPGVPGQPTAPGQQPGAGRQFFMNLSQNPNNYRYATCYFNSSISNIKGRADFRQFLYGNPAVDIRIQVVGLPRSPVDTQRGVHIHEYGDNGDSCSRVGPHYNPTQTRHGGRNSFAFLRHVGDLGNMLQSKEGVSSTQFRDSVISLAGRNSVIGRSLVIKLERDDEGTGTNSASQMNGNARTPLACCTVGRASNSNWAKPYSEQDLAALSGGVFVPSNTNTAPTQVQPAQGNNGLTFGSNTNTVNQPTNNGFNQPANTGFNQPTNTGFNQPANNGFNQPANTGFNQPANTGFNQPANNGFNQPANTGFNQPANTGFNQPANTGFNQPANNNAAQPLPQPQPQPQPPTNTGGGGNPFLSFGTGAGAAGAGGGGAANPGTFNFGRRK